MPTRAATGAEWQKMEKVLHPEMYPWAYPLLFANQKYMHSHQLLKKETKKVTLMTPGEKPLSFSDRELEDLADSFEYLGKVNPAKLPVARSIARFFRTGILDRRIA